MTGDQAVEVLANFVSGHLPTNQLPKADVILLCGNVKSGPELAVHAAELYKQGKAPLIIVSGNERPEVDSLPLGYNSEAQYLSEIIEKQGIKKDVIIVEEKATNTLENIVFSLALLKAHNVSPLSVILVSAPLNCLRANQTFKKQFPAIEVFPSSIDLPFAGWPLRNPLPRLKAEIDRLKNYSEKGDILKMEFPSEVIEAYEIISKTIQ